MIHKLFAAATLTAAVTLTAVATAPLLETGWPSQAHQLSAEPDYSGGIARQGSAAALDFSDIPQSARPAGWVDTPFAAEAPGTFPT
ncbi:hypothetical protein [Streptacidiphilus albus]|uniref:hypothetical protein n=1 Tax=Streptacidiphilus albus TaxID=105425 RepID=UPI00054B0051|nr:hypothetical protein [Streptacidiphilus albus]